MQRKDVCFVEYAQGFLLYFLVFASSKCFDESWRFAIPGAG
jgi:hypothetical protein